MWVYIVYDEVLITVERILRLDCHDPFGPITIVKYLVPHEEQTFIGELWKKHSGMDITASRLTISSKNHEHVHPE